MPPLMMPKGMEKNDSFLLSLRIRFHFPKNNLQEAAGLTRSSDLRLCVWLYDDIHFSSAVFSITIDEPFDSSPFSHCHCSDSSILPSLKICGTL